MRYEVSADGTISNGKVFYDFTATRSRGARRHQGRSAGQRLRLGPGRGLDPLARGQGAGRIVPPEHDANFAFGDADGKTLYLTASTGLYRIRTGIPGIRPQ